MSGHSPASIHLVVALNQEACLNSSGVGDSNTRPAGIYFAAGMIRQIYSIKPEDAATVRSSKLLAKLELEDINLILREREGFAGFGMWSVLVVQSEPHVIYRLKTGGGQGGPSLHGRN